jgi:hypothetical protein
LKFLAGISDFLLGKENWRDVRLNGNLIDFSSFIVVPKFPLFFLYYIKVLMRRKLDMCLARILTFDRERAIREKENQKKSQKWQQKKVISQNNQKEEEKKRNHQIFALTMWHY